MGSIANPTLLINQLEGMMICTYIIDAEEVRLRVVLRRLGV
jgi:hypothetical protein